MLFNYLTIAIRHLRRNKVFSIINLVGLALGLATFMVIFFLVVHHRGFDKYHTDADRIVRVGMKARLGGELIQIPTVGAPAVKAFRQDVPEVKDATHLYGRGAFHFEIAYNDKLYQGEQALFADANFFDFFSIPVIVGDPATVLSEPKSIVLTEDMVSKYFGDKARPADAVGKVLDIKRIGPVKVSGVCANVPSQTHFSFDYLLSADTNPENENTFWLANGFYTYVKLSEGNTVAQLESKFPQLIEKYIGPEITIFLGVGYAEFITSGGSFEFFTTPLKDIHLWSHYENELGANVNGTYINIFLAIGFLILLLAVINFINLSAAANIQRLKEVGVRKVMGARTSSLFFQFTLEAVLITLVAFGAALTVQQLVTPVISQYYGIEMGLAGVPMGWYLFIIVAGSLLVGFGAGLYPAMLLSTTRTTEALKGRVSSKTSRSRIRSVLSVVQFSISIALLAGVLVMNAQVRYLKNKPLGFDKDNVMVIMGVDALQDGAKTFRHELELLPDVQVVSITNYVPTGPHDYSRNAVQNPEEENPQTHRSVNVFVDEHFTEALGIRLLAGRKFSSEYGDEATNVIVNMAMCRRLGWSSADEAIGKSLAEVDNKVNHTVIGVVEDFHILRMDEPISPFFFQYGPSGFMAAVRFNTDDSHLLRSQVEDIWHQFSQEPLRLSFLDEFFQKNFEQEQKVSSLFEAFTILAVLLSGMGLFAMTAFITHQRTKEISIRKVLGAEGIRLFYVLARGVLITLLIAGVVGIPLVYFAMDTWLQSYPYRIAVPIWSLILPLLGMIIFALAVSGWHIVKVIRVNPVDTLRNE